MKQIISVLLLVTLVNISAQCVEPAVFYADGPKNRKAIALTFDDGPGPYTERILEVLKKYNVKATFFMEGGLIPLKPETVIKVKTAGHEIGSHLYSHPDFWNYKKPDFRDLWVNEAERTEKEFQKILGYKPVLMRMPHGYIKPWVKEEARKRGYILINWTCGYDWHKMTSEAMTVAYIKSIKPGAILLMHDGGKDRHRTLEMLPKVIEEAKSRGFEIVTISELLGIN